MPKTLAEINAERIEAIIARNLPHFGPHLPRDIARKIVEEVSELRGATVQPEKEPSP